MPSLSLATNQRIAFDPNPKDVAPGVGPLYVIDNPNLMSIDSSGTRPDIVPIAPGVTTFKIRGAVAPGQPYIDSDPIEVTITPGPPPPSFNRWEPVFDPPRTV